ncbi:MAG: ATP-dependent protease subunit HslV [Armatimonadetes bacterium]|nr:ATP-dependent protease subunit HslV [Armatimonadota bacterium]
MRSTTILAVKKDGHLAVGGDGQVTLDTTIMKHSTRKVMRLYQGKVLAGFAGAAADALTLLDNFEGRLQSARGNLKVASRDFVKEWRTDRILRRLEALMIVGDTETLLVVSGNGDIIEPDDHIAAIGSGGSYALAAARALAGHTDMRAEEIVLESLRIAASICIYTNDHIVVETL